MVKVWGEVIKMIECVLVMFICLDALGFNVVFFYNRNKVNFYFYFLNPFSNCLNTLSFVLQIKKIFHNIKQNWDVLSSDDEMEVMSKHANDGRLLTFLCTGTILETRYFYRLS